MKSVANYKTTKMIATLIFICTVLPLCIGQSGQWSTEVEACIRNHNDWTGAATSIANCQEKCEDQTSFICLSIDYKDGSCLHSRFNRRSVRPSSDYTQPCYNGHPWHYAERLDIEYGWTDIVSGCIRNHNDWTGTVSDLRACGKRCEDETSFRCLSIDYRDGTCNLSRFKQDTVIPSSDYTQPCYNEQNWQYAERFDVEYRWTSTVSGCIRNHNDWTGTVSDLRACQKRCEDETSFRCLSIDYRDGSCNLSRFNRDSVRPSSDYTQPCYNKQNWQYTERLDVEYRWTDIVSGCIRNHNDWTGTVSDLRACEKRCEEETSFLCLSIDYRDESCNLSRFNRGTVIPSSDYTQPCYNGQNWEYAERIDVVYRWTDIVSGCIRNHNDWTGTVSDLRACEKRCEDETSFRCLSIDYRDGSCNLSRFNRDSVRPSSDYTQPCYNEQNWQYAERLDVEYQWTDIVSGCIRNNNDRSETVLNLRACEKKCEDETSFICLSIDYLDGTCNLSSVNRDTVSPSSDYTQPCYVGGEWKYAERRNV